MFGKTMLYLTGAFALPKSAFDRLLRDRGQAAYAFAAVTGTAVLYAVRALVVGLAGGQPLTPSLVLLPPENHYAWQALLTLPVFWLAWISAAGMLQALGLVWRRGMEFRATLAAAGFALAAAALISWIPGAGGAVVLASGTPQAEWAERLSRPGVPQVLLVGFQAAALAWGFRLTHLSAVLTQRLNRGQALLAALATEATAVLYFALFIR